MEALLRRAARRERLLLGVRSALPVAFLSAAVLLLEGLLARVLPLPDLPLLRAILVALPGGAFLAGALRRVPRARAARRADGDLGTPCLFQAAAAQADSRLAPVIEEEAEAAAAGGLAASLPALPLPRWTGAGSLALLLAAAVSFAPGRAVRPDAAWAALLARAQAAASAAGEAARNPAWNRDQRAELAAAARELRGAARDRGPREMEQALERIGSLIEALARDGRPPGGNQTGRDAPQAGRPESAGRELESRLQRLLDLIESGALDALEIREAVREVRDAAEGSTPEQRERLDAIAGALESGDLAGASGLARREISRAEARRRALEPLVDVVLDHGAGGLPGSSRGTAPPAAGQEGGALRTPSGDTAPPGVPRAEATDLDQLQRLVLERYYARER